LQEELKNTGVTLTVLCPPATDTNFFRVAGAENSKIAQGNLATAEEVAVGGFEALMKGDARAVPTFKAKAEIAASNILPDSVMATAMHKQSEEVKPKRAGRTKKDSISSTIQPETASTATPPKKRTAPRKKE
jgi:uncharacterized protein